MPIKREPIRLVFGETSNACIRSRCDKRSNGTNYFFHHIRDEMSIEFRHQFKEVFRIINCVMEPWPWITACTTSSGVVFSCRYSTSNRYPKWSVNLSLPAAVRLRQHCRRTQFPLVPQCTNKKNKQSRQVG